MRRAANQYQYLFLVVIVLLAYAPVSSFLFALKNDAFTGYFPPKLFFSEILNEGHIPLWNPNLNFGFPIYGDMSMAWWNPVTWLVGGFAGYSVYTFTIEELLYIILAAFSFFKLTGFWKWHQVARINAALSYACGGYFIGHIQHFNWLSGMAFFPLVLLFYFRLTDQSRIKNYAGLSVCSYLFFTSAHPGLIIGGIYFLFFFMLPGLFQHIKRGSQALIHFSSVHILLFIILIATLAGPLYAYFEVVPHITRGTKIDTAISLAHPTTFQSWVSLLLPLATVKNDGFFLTDIAMRNCYAGLTTLIFFLSAFRKKMWGNYAQWICLILFFILLSAGGGISEIFNQFLPLIGYVRLTGEFTIFALTGIIMLAGFTMNDFLLSPENTKWKRTILWLAVIAAAAIIIALVRVIIIHDSIIFSSSPPVNSLKNKLKWLVDNITIWDAVLIQGCIQLIFLYLLFVLIPRNHAYFKWLIAADLVIAALLNIPFTGVGKMSPAEVQLLIDGAKQNKTILSQISDTTNIKKIIGDMQWYRKTPGNRERISYPMVLTDAEKYFLSPYKNTNDRKPYVFIDSGHLHNVKYTADKIRFDVSTPVTSSITLQQINYPGWKVTSNIGPLALVDHPDQLVSVEVSPSTTSAEIQFKNPVIKFLVYYSAAILLLLCFIFLFSRKKSKNSIA